MASSQSGTFSTATPHQNPFLSTEDSDRKVVAQEPLEPVVLSSSTVPAPATSGTATFSGNVSSTGTSTSTSSATAQSQASDLASRAQATLGSIRDNIQSTETKPGLAGNLAPETSPLAPEQAPAGTEHVTNIISGLGGAVASAPAAALEAISPVAASKVSDAAAAISARLPAISLADVQATATNLANKAYQAVPEGTAESVKGYAGAAVTKAQEVLPPALGGSTTTGNTGEGELAKPPSQLASEYGTTATEQAKGVAGQAADTIAAYAAAAQEKAAALAGIAQQKASETAATTQQAASETAATAQQKASDLGFAAQQKASDVSSSAQGTAYGTSDATRKQTASALEHTGITGVGQTTGATGQLGGTTTDSNTAGPGGYSFSREHGTNVSSDFPGSSSNQIDRVAPQ